MSNATPWLYVTLYVLAIISFAGAYLTIPADFYHPYVKYEGDVAAEAELLANQLTEAFRRQAKLRPRLYKQVELIPDRIRISHLRAEGTYVLFSLHVPIENRDSTDHWEFSASVPLRIDVQTWLFLGKTKDDGTYFYTPVTEGAHSPLAAISSAQSGETP